jgi:putative NADH-flavin reductase
MRVCIVGASGKLGQYIVQQSLDRGYEVVGVCREQSVGKLDAPARQPVTVTQPSWRTRVRPLVIETAT